MLRGLHHTDDFQELGAVAAESLVLKQCSLLDLQGKLPAIYPGLKTLRHGSVGKSSMILANQAKWRCEAFFSFS
jgi:hypothetical protein